MTFNPKLRTLRDYQDRGMNLLRQAYGDGKRKILFWLATGGGKSIIFLHLVAGLLKSGKRVCLVMRRRQLVLQTRDHFLKAGIPCSIMMASERGYEPMCQLQVCSIDTISRRDLAGFGKFDTVVVDEAHDAVSDTYKSFLEACQELGTSLFVGLTATPFAMGKRVHEFWDACVKPIEMHELCDLGFLVPCDLFVPEEMDYSGVPIDSKTGDFRQRPLAEMMSKLEVLGDVVQMYKDKGEGRPAICFAVNKDNSIKLCEQFNRSGVPAVHCDESTPQKERDRAISDLKSGVIKVLCNVNIFSTGVDIPEAEVGIMARPTRSEVLYVQQVGRLLRPYRRCGRCKSAYDNSPNCYTCGFDKPEYIKHRAIILDHGSNTGRHGRPYDVRHVALSREEAEKAEKEKESRPLLKTCKKCFIVYDAALEACPACGNTVSRENYIKTADGVLRPFDEFQHAKNLLDGLQTTAKIHNFKPNWAYFQLYKKMGDSCMVFKKELGIPSWVPKIVKKQLEEEQKGMVYQ